MGILEYLANNLISSLDSGREESMCPWSCFRATTMSFWLVKWLCLESWDTNLGKCLSQCRWTFCLSELVKLGITNVASSGISPFLSWDTNLSILSRIDSILESMSFSFRRLQKLMSRAIVTLDGQKIVVYQSPFFWYFHLIENTRWVDVDLHKDGFG